MRWANSQLTLQHLISSASVIIRGHWGQAFALPCPSPCQLHLLPTHEYSPTISPCSSSWLLILFISNPLVLVVVMRPTWFVFNINSYLKGQPRLNNILFELKNCIFHSSFGFHSTTNNALLYQKGKMTYAVYLFHFSSIVFVPKKGVSQDWVSECCDVDIESVKSKNNGQLGCLMASAKNLPNYAAVCSTAGKALQVKNACQGQLISHRPPLA